MIRVGFIGSFAWIVASITAFVIHLAAPSIAWPETTDVDPAAVVELLKAGMTSERGLIRQAVLRGHGKQTIQEDESVANSFECELHMFVAMDLDANSIRFDRNGPFVSGSPDRDAPKWKEVTWKLSHTPDRSLLYHGRFERLEVHRANVSQSDSSPRMSKFMDIRAVGLFFNEADMYRGLYFETIRDHIFGNRVPDECVNEGEGLYRLSWSSEVRKRTAWIDTKRGYTPIRTQMQFRLPEVGPHWMEPDVVIETGWKQFYGHWVPSSLSLFSRREVLPDPLPQPPYEYTRRYRTVTIQFGFDWESINQPVDPMLFEYDTFELPIGTYVVDSRTNERKVIEVIRESTPSGLASQGPRRSWLWIGILYGVVLAIGLIWWSARWTRRSRKA